MYRFIPIALLVLVPSLAFAASGQIYIEEKKDRIVIRVNRAPLGEVLQAIQKKTGIQFQVADTVLEDPIRVSITAPDWKAGVKQLLVSYDRMELWGDDLERSNIHILSGIEGKAAPLSKPKGFKPTNRPKTANNSPWTRSQLQTLSRGKLRSPLPSKLWDDASYRKFLQHYGMRKREDLQDIKKAINVRIRARRMLRELRKKNKVSVQEKKQVYPKTEPA